MASSQTLLLSFKWMSGMPHTHVSVGTVPPRLVLYDGVCGFCNKWVAWLLKVDRTARLRFAPLQGSTAAELRRHHPEIPQDLDSIVYVETTGSDERVYRRFEAILRICTAVELNSPILRWLRWLPRWCTDLAYRLFARNRYRVFGKLDACPVPAADESDRFLP